MKTVFLTGAGISVESGIRPYRGTNGIYTEKPVYDILNKDTYLKSPEVVNEYLDEMHALVNASAPNMAHVAIAEFAKTHDATIITQNIDDFFECAGATNVVHVHGEINKFACVGCNITVNGPEMRPDQCKLCGAPMRYDVVLFGETAPHYDTLNTVINSLHKGDNFVVIGTSGVVLPINRVVRRLGFKGVTTYLNNFDSTPDIVETFFTHVFKGKATEQVPRILEHIMNK